MKKRMNLAIRLKAQPSEYAQMMARDYLTQKIFELCRNPKGVLWRWLPGPRMPLAPQYLEVSWQP